MNKKTLVLICLVAFVVGCIPTEEGNGTTDIDKDLYTGSQGVLVEVIDNNFPEEVYEREEISYVVKLTNIGPYEAKGKLIATVDKDYMSFNSNGRNYFVRSNIQLDKKTQLNNIDDFTIIDNIIKVGQLDDLSEIHEGSILTTFCYDYKGIAVTDVCVDTDPFETSATQGTCKTKNSINLGGQGGPVVIDRIEPKMAVDSGGSNEIRFIRPQFKIHLSNTGRGTVFQRGKVDQVCSREGLSRETYNAVTLENIELSEYDIDDFECLPDELVLREEEDFFTCTLKSGAIKKSDPSFTSPLKITISYGYAESVSKEVTIRKQVNY